MISAEQNALGVILYGVHMERRGWGGGGGSGVEKNKLKLWMDADA